MFKEMCKDCTAHCLLHTSINYYSCEAYIKKIPTKIYWPLTDNIHILFFKNDMPSLRKLLRRQLMQKCLWQTSWKSTTHINGHLKHMFHRVENHSTDTLKLSLDRTIFSYGLLLSHKNTCNKYLLWLSSSQKSFVQKTVFN